MSDEDNAPPPPKASGPSGPLSRKKKIVLGVLGVVLLTGGVVGGRVGVIRYLARREAQREGAALFRCLFGPKPAEGELPTLRLRRVFLTAQGLAADEAPSATGPAWPGRCAAHAVKVADALVRGGKADDAPPQDFAQKVLGTARDAYGKPPFAVEALWELASEDGGPADVPLAPAPAAPIDARAPDLADRLSFADLSADPVPGKALRLLLHGARANPPRICTFRESLDEARCAFVHERARLTHGVLGPSAEDGAPALVTDTGASRSTFFRADTGETFGAPMRTLGGFATAAGVVGLVEAEVGAQGETSALWLERRKDGKKLDRTKIEPAPKVRWSSVTSLGDRLAWIEPRGAKKHLFLRRLGADASPAGTIEDAGEIAHDAVQLSACHAGEKLAVVAREGRSFWFSLRDAAGGTPLRRFDGEPLPADAVVESESLTCEDAAAAHVAVIRTGSMARPSWEVRRVRCEAAACEESRVRLDALIDGRGAGVRPAPMGRESPVAAASVGEPLLVAWRTEDAGLRARIGKPAELGRAVDMVLYDEASQDANHGGRLHAVRAFGRPGAALLLLSAGSGPKAIRVGADGTFSAVRAVDR
jgi:hypothetical protein